MEEQMIRVRLDVLKTEHRDLDAAIDALVEKGAADQLRLARMKEKACPTR